VATSCLVIWPVNEFALYDIAPEWLNFLFVLRFVEGLQCWVGLITVYFLVGYYGHKALDRVRSHPVIAEPKNQRRLRVYSPFIFLLFLYIVFSSQAAETVLKETSDGKLDTAFLWDPLTVLVDQGAGLVFIVLLSQAVRCLGSWLTPIGACALGIYLGGDIAFFCPNTTSNMIGASFGIIIDKVAVIPPMQGAVIALASIWPIQVLVVFLYNVFQVIVFGVPFQWVYLTFLAFFDVTAKTWQSNNNQSQG